MLLEIQDHTVNSALYFVLTYESRVGASAPPLLNVRRTDPASFQRVQIRNQQIKIQLENAVIVRNRKQPAVKNLLWPSQRIYVPGTVNPRSDDSVRHFKNLLSSFLSDEPERGGELRRHEQPPEPQLISGHHGRALYAAGCRLFHSSMMARRPDSVHLRCSRVIRSPLLLR